MSLSVVTISLKTELSAALAGPYENQQALAEALKGQDYALIEKTFGRGQYMNVSLPTDRMAEFTAAVGDRCVVSEKLKMDSLHAHEPADRWSAFLKLKDLSY